MYCITEKGRTVFIDVGGMRILHRTCKECSMCKLCCVSVMTIITQSCIVLVACAKASEPLLSIATMILRRCQPRFRLPIPTVQCTFKFTLPQTVEKTTIDIHVPTASSTFGKKTS